MSAAVLLGLVLAALAVSDILAFAGRREWKAAALSTGLWAAGIFLAVLGAAGVELPSLSRWLIRLTRPIATWIP